jgi:hypothetical protein
MLVVGFIRSRQGRLGRLSEETDNARLEVVLIRE